MGARFRSRARSVIIDKPILLTRRVSSNISDATQSIRFSANSRKNSSKSINRLSLESRNSFNIGFDWSPKDKDRKGARQQNPLLRTRSVPIPEEEMLSNSTDITNLKDLEIYSNNSFKRASK